MACTWRGLIAALPFAVAAIVSPDALADDSFKAMNDRNPEDSREDSLVDGTIYGGVLLALREGKVSEIFAGAAAA